ncbi:MAG: TerB family tellurite resistance protein [Solobacterium sp.]|jgi:uncharacterized tellurite resistance protein B-like protein|nr:TerB family tellurite resistance protein [Solobacterium sp.]MCH4223069.1 TerB family tellurite resistance protein [Solobacterium sp.]MCH4265990.1 TerB family tellurite resistance protein [Solobacterium sp.]
MGLFDQVTKKMSETAGKISEAAKNVKPEDIQSGLNKFANEAGKVTSTVSQSAGRIVETAKTVKPEDIKKNTEKMINDAGAAIAKHNAERKETQTQAKELLNQKKDTVPALTVHHALQIVYLMMSADMAITPEEEQTFESIGKDLDPQYDSHHYEVIQECCDLTLDAVKSDNYIQSLCNIIAKDVEQSAKAVDAVINGKVMLWNLEAIAYADGVCSPEEQQIVRFTAEQLNVPQEILQEMEYSIRTILAVNREEQYLKDSNRTYTVVEPQVNELEVRKEKIMQGVHALLVD